MSCRLYQIDWMDGHACPVCNLVNCALHSNPARRYSRRLSAAGLASSLKNKALIEPRPPLTRTSYSERPSIFDPESPPPPPVPDTRTQVPPPTAAGPSLSPRSSASLQRKRRMSSGSGNGGADGKRAEKTMLHYSMTYASLSKAQRRGPLSALTRRLTSSQKT